MNVNVYQYVARWGMFVGEESWQVVVGAPQRYRAKLWPVPEDYAMSF